MAGDDTRSLCDLLRSARSKTKKLENFGSASDPAYQDTLHSAITELKQCRILVQKAALFSSNEEVEDIATPDLEYLLVDYYLGDLLAKQNTGSRRALLSASQDAFESYLHRLDSYRMLSIADIKLYETFTQNRDDFSVMQTKDATARREQKIERYQEEKALKARLEHLHNSPRANTEDDESIRSLHLAEISLATHQTFQDLDSIAQELKILAMRPPTPPPSHNVEQADHRERNGTGAVDVYSERVDRPMAELLNKGKAGPILDKDGRPLRPFTLLDNRTRLKDGVFRPDHSLPTMTIDEYLEEEKRRGGIIGGDGGEASAGGARPRTNEDSMDLADAETMKAREWDEFVEANPKGSGNTLNRG